MWVAFEKDGHGYEVRFTGSLNGAIDIDKVLIDGEETEEEIEDLETWASEAYYGV